MKNVFLKARVKSEEITMEGSMNQSIPQWKRDLIMRRRAVGRVLPTENGSVQLTCPSVVAAVRFAEYSVNSDFLRRCESERDQTGGSKNMRLTEQVPASDEFVESSVGFDIKEIITKIESKNTKMGEEKTTKKLSTSPLICDQKSNDIDDSASDSSEEFKYGPGIVSKLKSKYLSLTLRESQGRTRPPLDSLRRATSLENILDETEKGELKTNYLNSTTPVVNGTPQRCRGLSRVNKDSMKRARSVEVLTRYDRTTRNPEKIEEANNRKIRSRISSSSVEETELPPPDHVKHTLKIFEQNQPQKKNFRKEKPRVVRQNGVDGKIDSKKGSDVVNNSTVGKCKAALLKTSETVIESEKTPLKSTLSLDLTDAAPHKRTSPLTSPRSVESPEPKRCISPVLVRAPPCILSSELNTPPPPMKQVGVIRPMVTNKKPHLTEREIEKNLINKVKSIEQPVTKVIVSLKKSPEECFVNNETPKPNDCLKKGQYWDKKPNTMVFNFSNRKTVPDYIENDGLILAPRKEKPKLEPGIIFLGGGTEDSSTDFDPEELSSDPPLPCDIIFEGDNILINGKSNLQSKPKLRKMKIQFNDEATTMFEYPSEASLLDDGEESKPECEVPSTMASSPGLPNPFRCSGLASYTPSKVSLSTDFQLGVTKTNPPPPPPPKQAEHDGGEEEEEEGYLRPADENSTVSWSAETAADLLF